MYTITYIWHDNSGAGIVGTYEHPGMAEAVLKALQTHGDYSKEFALLSHDTPIPDAFITTSQAAIALNITVRRVEALINAKRLPAQKIGRDWLIRLEDLELVKMRRPGRPRAA